MYFDSMNNFNQVGNFIKRNVGLGEGEMHYKVYTGIYIFQPDNNNSSLNQFLRPNKLILSIDVYVPNIYIKRNS
jgi:hypothetical protein